jgi:CIC family chloride channel protein
VVEMTGNFSLLVPAMGAVAVACLVTAGPGIYRAQVETKADSEAHRGKFEISILENVTAASSMTPADQVIALHPGDESRHVLSLIRIHGHTGFPVLDDGRLAGIMTIQDVRQVREQSDLNVPVQAGMTRDPLTITPDTTLDKALKIMIEHDINHLPVVDPEDAGRMVGFLTRTDIMRAYARCSNANSG